MIFHMEYLPGDRLSELQIAEKLQISRTPIHDAVRRLAADGIVTIETNRSAIVTKFSEEEIREIGTIRLSQDVLSAQLASYYGSAADFDNLYRMAEACEDAATKGDIYGRIQADNAFHLEIAKISGNTHLYHQQESIYQRIHLIQILKYTDIEESLKQIYHHEPIIEAIRSGDMPEVSRLICEHVKDFYQIDPYLLKCYA